MTEDNDKPKEAPAVIHFEFEGRSTIIKVQALQNLDLIQMLGAAELLKLHAEKFFQQQQQMQEGQPKIALPHMIPPGDLRG